MSLVAGEVQLPKATERLWHSNSFVATAPTAFWAVQSFVVVLQK